MKMINRLKKYAVFACASYLAFSAAIFVHGQTSNNVAKLRQQLSAHYQIVPLEDGLALVPRERNTAIRLVEVRNGAVAINGAAVTAREAAERLGRDADLIIQATYLDAAAQRELARAGSAGASAPANTPDITNQSDGTEPQRTQRHRGDLVRFGGSVTVARDEFVDGDVVAIGGSADIDGEVAREVTVVGGSLNLGPEAIVRGDVTVVGGSLNRASGARIDGKVSEVAMGAQFPTIPRGRRIFPLRTFLPRVGSFVGTLLRMALLILFALIVVVLGGRFVEAIADRAAAEPLRSGLAGLLAEVLFVPLLILTIVVLAVSIVGIPFLFLVPFAMVLAFVLMLVGFTGVSCLVGRLLSNRYGITRGPYVSVAVGVLAVVGITLLAKLIALLGGFFFGVVVASSLAAIGYLAEYIAWTIGIGAVILTWFSARRRGTPAAAVAGPPAGEAPAH
jgi:hypothetical protein